MWFILKKSKKLSLSHGKGVRILGQKMRKYINDLVVLRQLGIFKPTKRGKIVIVSFFFFSGPDGCIVAFYQKNFFN